MSSEVALLPKATLFALEEAVSKAASASFAWRSRTPLTRAKIVASLANALDAGREILAANMVDELNASQSWIDFNIAQAKQALRQAAALSPFLDDQVLDERQGGKCYRLVRQPVGVVLSIVPWNAPIVLTCRAIATALVCGNTVILKGSEHCPNTHNCIVEILNEAGLPQDTVVVVNVDQQQSLAAMKYLVNQPVVRRINFTGSTRAGRLVSEEAGRALKRCLLELSGKAALIALDDADIDAAVAATVYGAFENAGQICMSTEIALVDNAIAGEFIESLRLRTEELIANDQYLEKRKSLGSVVTEEAAYRIAALVEDAVSKGAEIIAGGSRTGKSMQPTVVDRVRPGMRLYTEECFGPVVSIVRFLDVEEAISIANDSEFGLTSAVFGADVSRCLKIANQLETGVCQINGPTLYDDPSMPFGGLKSSGYGRFGGSASLDEFSELQWIVTHSAKRT